MNDQPWWERPSPFAVGAELAPWATPDLTIRLDQIQRRRRGLQTILRWRDGWELWADARSEIDRMDATFDAWWADCETRMAAWASWPTEIAAWN